MVYERGDSIALAVGSGRIDIPTDSPFSKVLQFNIDSRCVSSNTVFACTQEMEDLIRYILVVDPKERPFLEDVIQRVKQFEAKSQGCL